MAVVEVSQANGRVPVAIFRLRERIHLENVSELENQVKQAYESGTRNIIIDLEQSNSFTSIGLRALVVIHKILSKDDNEKHLKVAGATAMVHEIMQVTGISQFIDVYDTVEEAIASF